MVLGLPLIPVFYSIFTVPYFLNSYSYSGFHVLFYRILIDTKSVFNNFAGIQRPFSSEHAPGFIF